jgi:hypothetical protein
MGPPGYPLTAPQIIDRTDIEVRLNPTNFELGEAFARQLMNKMSGLVTGRISHLIQPRFTWMGIRSVAHLASRDRVRVVDSRMGNDLIRS